MSRTPRLKRDRSRSLSSRNTSSMRTTTRHSNELAAEPQAIPEWAIPTRPVKMLGWNLHSTNVRNPVMRIKGQPVDLTRTAVEAWNSTDPLSRLAGMRNAVTASLIRGADAGASLGETVVLFSLLGLLEEVNEGDFSNAIWKACKAASAGSKRKSSFDRQEAEAMIILLCQQRSKMDGLTEKDYEKACSRVAFDLDDRLKLEHGYELSKWLSPYRTEPSGDPNSDNRQRKEAAVWEDERRHPMAGRIKRWSVHDKPKLQFIKRVWDGLNDYGPEKAYLIMLSNTASKIVVSASDSDPYDCPQGTDGGTQKTNIGR